MSRPLHSAHFHVAIVDDSAVRAAIVEDGLRSAGVGRITVFRPSSSLLRELADVDPDVVIIDLEEPSRDALEQMFAISRALPRPVAMFVDRSDTGMIEAAVDAGVSAYVVDGLKKERIKPILDMSISRFRAFARLKDELAQAKSELEDRKTIDRAKGLLMKMKAIDEPAAYALLRRAAMEKNRRLVEVAQSIITAAELLE